MSKLSTTDQFKILRSEFREVKLEAFSNASSIRDLDHRVKILSTDLEDFKNSLEKSLFDWKSQIHDLIDQGFTGKAKALDEETLVLNARTTDLRTRVEKLEANVLNN